MIQHRQGGVRRYLAGRAGYHHPRLARTAADFRRGAERRRPESAARSAGADRQVRRQAGAADGPGAGHGLCGVDRQGRLPALQHR
ncbi:hypothetical protein G6F32_015608 [Rhizopus arrhizus]|nr:hypothetical protein G6F32_015608 [Rhizopus arrhizus]